MNEKTKQTDFPFKLIWAGIVQARKNQIFENENYSLFAMEYVLKGKGYLEINGKKFEISKGDVYFLHRHSYHRYYPDERQPWKKIFFTLDGPLVDSLVSVYNLESTYVVRNCDVKHLFIKMLRHFKTQRGENCELAPLIFHELLTKIRLSSGDVSSFSEPVRFIRNYLDANVIRRVRLNNLARTMKISVQHVIRIFKKECSMTPYDYLVKRRIESAKVMLKQTGMSVKEIAYKLQYSDPYYFSNFFKRKTGISPIKYRKSKL